LLSSRQKYSSSRHEKYGVDEPTDPACWADDSESGFSPEEVTYAERLGKAKSKHP
jgi:hypothetical protein